MKTESELKMSESPALCGHMNVMNVPSLLNVCSICMELYIVAGTASDFTVTL